MHISGIDYHVLLLLLLLLIRCQVVALHCQIGRDGYRECLPPIKKTKKTQKKTHVRKQEFIIRECYLSLLSGFNLFKYKAKMAVEYEGVSNFLLLFLIRREEGKHLHP